MSKRVKNKKPRDYNYEGTRGTKAHKYNPFNSMPAWFRALTGLQMEAASGVMASRAIRTKVARHVASRSYAPTTHAKLQDDKP